MTLKEILLINFRNYSEFNTAFNPGINIIFGENGNGKTNILEAISYLSYGKSFLGSADEDCLKLNEKRFDIKGELGSEKITYKIRCEYEFTKRKKFFEENKQIPATKIFGRFPIVTFSPHSMAITYGNTSERRRFFDIAISQTSSIYFDSLKRYNKLVKQKNTLLKIMQQRGASSEEHRLLSVYNEKLAELSVKLASMRIEFLNSFLKRFCEIYSGLVSLTDECSIIYETNSDNEEKLIRLQKDKLQEEIARGICVTGVHKDDYKFFLKKSKEKIKLKEHGSQGEHKTFITALKLAEYEYVKERTGISPMILLDDILSELDEKRVEQIINSLKNLSQIFLTTTDYHYNDKLRELFGSEAASTYKISKGELVEKA